MPIRKILNVNLTGRWFVSRILWLDVHLDKHVNMLISTIILNVFIYPWSQVSSCWVKKTDLFLKPWSLIDLRCLARNIPDINLVNISILIAFCLLLETLETSHADVVVERAVHWIFIGWLLSIFSMTRWILLFFERKNILRKFLQQPCWDHLWFTAGLHENISTTLDSSPEAGLFYFLSPVLSESMASREKDWRFDDSMIHFGDKT